MSSFDRILVPVDFSECSKRALNQALVLAERFDSSIELLHVYEPPYSVGDAIIHRPDSPSMSMQDYIREQAELMLARMIEDLDCEKLESNLASGIPYDEIQRRLDEGNFSLVIMGSHGRRGLSHLLMGSVTERILRHAPCPVLVVRDRPSKDD